MRDIFNGSRRNDRIIKAVVDAEPLLSVLVLNYVRSSRPTRRDSILNISRISDYLKDKASQGAFLRLFDSIPTILTTSHVIAEVNGLQKLRDQYKREFWESGMFWLREKGLDERLIRLLDMCEEGALRASICEIGPVDTGLIRLALEEGCPLLTDDKKTLAVQAWKQGVDCRVVEDYIRK